MIRRYLISSKLHLNKKIAWVSDAEIILTYYMDIIYAPTLLAELKALPSHEGVFQGSEF